MTCSLDCQSIRCGYGRTDPLRVGVFWYLPCCFACIVLVFASVSGSLRASLLSMSWTAVDACGLRGCTYPTQTLVDRCNLFLTRFAGLPTRGSQALSIRVAGQLFIAGDLSPFGIILILPGVGRVPRGRMRPSLARRFIPELTLEQRC